MSLNLTTQPQQRQQLVMNLALKQALYVLELPLLELADWLEAELEENPLWEVQRGEREVASSSHLQAFDSTVSSQPSLYEHLMQQMRLVCRGKEIEIAELIVGNLNEKGFLDVPLEQISPFEPLQAVLKKLQECDPAGIAAQNVQESLLLQLERKVEQETLQYEIVASHFDLMLQGKFSSIAKQMQREEPEIRATMHDKILCLDPYPGRRFAMQEPSVLFADLHLFYREEKWMIEVNTSALPKMTLHPSYAQMKGAYVKEKVMKGKWLKQAVQKRKKTLEGIGKCLLKFQRAFFEMQGRGALVPLTCSQVAQELHLNESTIARAVLGKFLSCPQGIFPLRFFFNQGPQESISSESIKKLLKQMIGAEDKQRPLSDADLLKELQKRGVKCARRTVAKYRAALQIPSCRYRKGF